MVDLTSGHGILGWCASLLCPSATTAYALGPVTSGGVVEILVNVSFCWRSRDVADVEAPVEAPIPFTHADERAIPAFFSITKRRPRCLDYSHDHSYVKNMYMWPR